MSACLPTGSSPVDMTTGMGSSTTPRHMAVEESLGGLAALSAAIRFKQTGRLGLGYVVVGAALVGSGFLPKDAKWTSASASLVVGASSVLTLGLAQQAAEYSRGRSPFTAVVCGLGAVAAATATSYHVIETTKEANTISSAPHAIQGTTGGVSDAQHSSLQKPHNDAQVWCISGADFINPSIIC